MTDTEHNNVQGEQPQPSGLDQLFGTGDTTKPIPTLDEAREDDDPETPKRRIGTRAVIIGSIAVLTAGAIAGGINLLDGHAGGQDKGRPDPDTRDRQTVATLTPSPASTPEDIPSPLPSMTAEASASPSPEPVTTPSPEAAQATGLEIPAGKSFTDFGKTLIEDRLSPWLMMGADDALFQRWLNGNAAYDADLLKTTSEANAQKMADALFIPDWQVSETLTEFHDKEMQANAANIDSWCHTYDSLHPGDLAPWNSSVTFDSASLVAGNQDGRIIKIVGTEHNNADQNRIGSVYNPAEKQYNGSHFTFVITTKIADGTERIASWANISPQQ